MRGSNTAKMTPAALRSFRRLMYKLPLKYLADNYFPVSVSQLSKIRSGQHWADKAKGKSNG